MANKTRYKVRSIGEEDTINTGQSELDTSKEKEISEESNTEPKRKRGRPKGSKNTKREVSENQPESISISESKTPVKRGRKPKKPATMSDDEAKSITTFVMELIDNLAENVLGTQEARKNQIENLMLEISLPKMLTTLEYSTIETTSKILYPIALISGLGLYGLRLTALYNQKQKDKEEKSKSVLDNQEPIQEDNHNEGDLWTKTLTLTPNMI